MTKPIIAIIGRPNVGKSTLFNRLVGGRRAIVHDQPGVTRDRNYAEAVWKGQAYTVVDTGGYEPSAREGLVEAVRRQAELALQEASLVLFVVDVKEGLTPADAEIARILRQKATKPVFLVANKAEGKKGETLALEFYRLGFEELFPVSAEQGLGIGELMDRVVAAVPSPVESVQENPVTVAVIGRPNVGKSSFVNRILGEERVIVDDLPGTTRDAVDTPFVYRAKPYLLIDTAGIRAPGRVTDLERYCILRARRRVERADVALVIIDASQGVTAQDTKIAGIAHEAGCGIVLVANKWDLVKEELANEFVLAARDRTRYLDYAPLVLASAKTGFQVMHCLDVVDAVNAERRKRIPTPELNTFIGEVVAKVPPPPFRGRRVKIHFVTQTKGPPPTFLFFISGAPSVHFSYRRYLENRLRETYGFRGVPLRLIFRERGKG